MSYVLLGILAAVLFSLFSIPVYTSQIGNTSLQLENNFPATLKISWDKQQLVTSEKPLILPYPQFLPSSGLPPTFGVIDPSKSSPNSDSFFFVNNNKLFVSAGPSNWSEFPLKELPGFENSFTIDKSSLPTFVQEWKSAALQTLQAMPFFVPFAYIFFLPVIRLFQILLDSLLIFLILRLANRKFSYQKIYQISLHITVVAETIRVLTDHLLGASNLPMFSLAFWGYFMIVFFQLRKVRMIQIKK